MAENNADQQEQDMNHPSLGIPTIRGHFMPLWLENLRNTVVVNEQARIYYIVHYKFIMNYVRLTSFKKRKHLEYWILLLVNFHMI